MKRPPLTAEQKAALDDLVKRGNYALRMTNDGDLELAYVLQEINREKLFQPDSKNIHGFAQSVFGIGRSYTYDYLHFAEVCDNLVAAGVEPLSTKSHSLSVYKLPTPEMRVAAVQFGRELAEQGSARLTALHFEAACKEIENRILAPDDPAVGDGVGPVNARPGAAERAAVRDYDGLVVALPSTATQEAAKVLAQLPGKSIVPYADTLTLPILSTRETDASSFTRAALDDLTDLTWPVVAPDPWDAAESWTTPEAFNGVYYPDRITAPLGRITTGATEREQTVLICPGVDLLATEVPPRIVHAVVKAAGADTRRCYLLLTAFPERVWKDWPGNVYVAVEAVGTSAAVEAAVLPLGRLDCPRALIVRDLTEPVEPGVLAGVDWLLVRGAKTKQAAYDSLRKCIHPDCFDRGRDVKARHSAYPGPRTPVAAVVPPPHRAAKPPTGLQAVPRPLTGTAA